MTSAINKRKVVAAMTKGGMYCLAAAAFLAGGFMYWNRLRPQCWPADTVGEPELASGYSHSVEKASLVTESVPCSVVLPKGVKEAHRSNELRTPSGARLFVMYSLPREDEASAFGQMKQALMRAELPDGASKLVVARPWIGYARFDPIPGGRIMGSHYFYGESDYLEVHYRIDPNNEQQRREAEEVLAFVLHSVRAAR